MVDYSFAGHWADHVRALAIIESREEIWTLGDGGEAFGLLQMHPADFIEHYRVDATFKADVHDKWWIAQIKAAANFFEKYVPSIGLDLAVQAWNKGVTGVTVRGERDLDYLAKWSEAFQRIRGSQ